MTGMSVCFTPAGFGFLPEQIFKYTKDWLFSSVRPFEIWELEDIYVLPTNQYICYLNMKKTKSSVGSYM